MAYEGKLWLDVVKNSRFIVCPRGFGRSAFKLYETLDLRRVPIYIYDDLPWLPYMNRLEWTICLFLFTSQDYTGSHI